MFCYLFVNSICCWRDDLKILAVWAVHCPGSGASQHRRKPHLALEEVHDLSHGREGGRLGLPHRIARR